MAELDVGGHGRNDLTRFGEGWIGIVERKLVRIGFEVYGLEDVARERSTAVGCFAPLELSP